MHEHATTPLCEQCAAPIQGPLSRGRIRRFCSSRCRGIATATLPPAECVICSTTITLRNKPSRPRRYCSDACYKVRSRSLADRFWSKVNKDGPVVRSDLGPCWIWTGALDG